MEPVILVLSFQVRELSAEVLGPRDARCHRCERDRSQTPGQHWCACWAEALRSPRSCGRIPV